MKNASSVFNEEDRYFEDERNVRLLFKLGKNVLLKIRVRASDSLPNIEAFTEQLARSHNTQAASIGIVTLCYPRSLTRPKFLS